MCKMQIFSCNAALFLEEYSESGALMLSGWGRNSLPELPFGNPLCVGNYDISLSGAPPHFYHKCEWFRMCGCLKAHLWNLLSPIYIAVPWKHGSAQLVKLQSSRSFDRPNKYGQHLQMFWNFRVNYLHQFAGQYVLRKIIIQKNYKIFILGDLVLNGSKCGHAGCAQWWTIFQEGFAVGSDTMDEELVFRHNQQNN